MQNSFLLPTFDLSLQLSSPPDKRKQLSSLSNIFVRYKGINLETRRRRKRKKKETTKKKLEERLVAAEGKSGFPSEALLSRDRRKEESCKDRGCRSGTYHGWMGDE